MREWVNSAADTYAIPFREKFLIYTPLKHVAFIGDKTLAEYVLADRNVRIEHPQPEVDKFLEIIGFKAKVQKCSTACPPSEILPTNAVLLMTNKCNLRCVYCYANAGSGKRVSEMTWPNAKTTIDFVVDNAAKTCSEPPCITFHGGGEPTLHWDLLVRCVDYVNTVAPSARISMTSNGVWTDRQRQFICDHFTEISLSMDGMPEVQNRQRPMKDGGATDKMVWESIAALDETGINYGIRMTVLPDSANRLSDGVELVCRESKARSIQIEPTFTCGRGRYADIDEKFADDFSENFMIAWRIGRAENRHVYYSGARPWVIASMFCQAPLKAAVLTADGRLVTCFEVFSKNDPLAEEYTVGRVHKGQIEYNNGKLQEFLNAQKKRRQKCKECFCYWHCCGDCATRRASGNNNKNQGRCRVTRHITRALLLAYMEANDGFLAGFNPN